MKFVVVHSSDPYLLARLCTDLELHEKFNPSSFVDDNDWIHPWDTPPIEWLHVGDDYADPECFSLANHPCESGPNYPVRYELTDDNYIDVLTSMLNL